MTLARSILGTLWMFLILFVLFLVMTLVASIAVVGIGRIVALVSGLSAFESTLIALGTALGVLYWAMRAVQPQHVLEREPDWMNDDEDEDFFDEDEEDEDFFAQEKIAPPPGRNAPCPCGSGKKYKHCHGKVA